MEKISEFLAGVLITCLVVLVWNVVSFSKEQEFEATRAQVDQPLGVQVYITQEDIPHK